MASVGALVAMQWLQPLIIDEAEEATTPTTSNPSLQTLQVRPAFGQPTPLGTPLQGTPNDTQGNRDSLQQAQQGIQEQAGDSLQPNAGLDGLPDDF